MVKVMCHPLAEKMLDKFIRENKMTAIAELCLVIILLMVNNQNEHYKSLKVF